jgi:hypothetical protein
MVRILEEFAAEIAEGAEKKGELITLFLFRILCVPGGGIVSTHIAIPSLLLIR